jgi:hypothetical protein
MNRRGEKPLTLEGNKVETPEIGYVHNVGQDVTRFDRKKKKNFRR